MAAEWEHVGKVWSVWVPARSMSIEEIRSNPDSPEVKSWVDEHNRALAAGDALSFRKDPRCRPGALIEIRGKDAAGDLVTRTLLIGHINLEGGMCGCCCEMKDEDEVLRVKNLLEE